MVKDDARKIFGVFREILFGKISKNEIPSEIMHENWMITDLVTICDTFNDEFIKIPTKLNQELSENNNYRNKYCTMSYCNDHTIFMDEATESEITLAIDSLKNNASPGFDAITTNIIKTHHQKLAPISTKLINKLLSSGNFPEILKFSKVVPIHKAGPNNIITNYRPVALISNLEKVIEKFLHSRITSFFDSYKIFGNQQFGFRKNSSTTSAIINLLVKIQEALDKGLLVATLFLDLSKAFVTIEHDRY